MSAPGWGPPPGWYPDPWDSRMQRRWDGVRWTPDAGPAPAGPANVLDWEEAMTPWVRLAVIVFPLLSIVVCLIAWAEAPRWAQYFHEMRLLFDNLGQVPPPKTPTVPVVSYAGGLVLVPEIIFVMWQYRAATLARALGYPARRGPAWGIVAYLVPVADLFVPAQALGDCLPPGDPCRRLVLRTWAALMVASVLQSSLIVVLAEARPAGLVLMAAAIAAYLVLLYWGRQMVDAITDNHRQALGRFPGSPG